MLETIRQGESILEVQEWINKSSGRGKFILKVEEDGEEKHYLKGKCLVLELENMGK